MNMDHNDWSWMGPMLHFADSALPVGSYAHSLGLEGLCQAGVVHDSESLRTFLLRDVAEALEAGDLPLMVRAHEAVREGGGEDVGHWDRVSWALRPTRQVREAASKIGRQVWAVYETTWRGREAGLQAAWFPHFQAPVVTGARQRGQPGACAHVGSRRT